MASELSAYAILGLEPGADRASIDAAYRRLIKQHHPDRSGGDAERAADINRAYRELRRTPVSPGDAPPASDISEAIYARRAGRSRVPPPVRRRFRLWPFAALLAAGAIYLERERLFETIPALRDLFAEAWTPALGAADPAPQAGAVMLDSPLADAAVADAIRDAARLGGASEDLLAEQSRACHRAMRAEASLARLDRCAAFDYAVTMMDGRDPVRDEGPFSASAVTARQMAAARLLSNDFLEIEARLDRIRHRVELTLSPAPLASGGAETPPRQ